VDGALQIRIAKRDGEPRVVESYARAPFHYLPPSREEGGVPRLTIVNSSGGILGGDALDMSIALDSHVSLSLRTQAATKIHRSAGGPARSVGRFTLGDGALLDYFPDEIIPFAGSDYTQITQVEIAANATMLLGEIVTAGRIARGERFGFARLALDLQCTSDGALLLRDRSDLQPTLRRLDDRSILGDATIWGSYYLLTARSVEPALIEELDEVLRGVGEGTGGATAGPVGVVGRVVSNSLDAVRGAFEQIRLLVLSRWPSLGGER